ncbi:ABC transporter substrate-binding protein [Paenibacillus sp. GCM10027628]|uniref:ABC transporter substrate-binding protein n=1 Tax=Paenibacillus sp. GCM10027628 TaxID=3273413 RepID=UPI00363613C7
MFKKWKTIAGSMAVTVTAATMLSACGSSTDSQSGSTPGSKAKDDSKPYEISMAFINFQNMPDVGAVQEEISKITKQKINATVKLIPISISAWTQQTNLMLAGNEKLDLLVSSAFFNYGSQVAKGQLIPLDDLLEKKGQGIKGVFEPEILNATKIDGKIYGVPSTRDMAADFGMVMRKDLVEKYHIDLSKVKSFSDLEPAFQAIKDGEPGVAPVVQQTQGQSGQTVAQVITGASFDPLGDSLGGLTDTGGNLKVVNIFETQEYADAIALARKWYQAGYIMKDIATSQETGPSLVKAGKAFGYVANLKPGFEIQESRNSGTELVGVRLTKPVTFTSSITSFMMSITKNSDNPEKAMEFLNLMYTDKDIANLIDNGIEGKHYVKKSDTIIAKPDGVKESGYMLNEWEVGNNYLSYIWEGEDPQNWEKMKQFNKSSIRSKALGFTFNVDPVKTEVAAATNVLNQYRVGLETGTLDPAGLQEFNAKLKSAGLDKIIAEKQKQLDAWAKTAAK